jgi:hypothetical protein
MVRHPPMTRPNNHVSDLADTVALLLAGVPEDKRTEAAVRILHDYGVALAEQFPGTSQEQRRRFLVAFFALLQKRQRQLAVGGTA